MNDNRLKFRKLAAAAARLADSKKASGIKIYDIAEKSDAAYFALIATVESQPQMRAVEDEVSVGLKRAEGVHALHRDGLLSRTWKVMDYGGLIVHIFEPAARAFYALDRLYEGCGQVDWEAKPSRRPAAGLRAPKAGNAAPFRPVAELRAPTAGNAALFRPAAKKAPAKKAAPRKK